MVLRILSFLLVNIFVIGSIQSQEIENSAFFGSEAFEDFQSIRQDLNGEIVAVGSSAFEAATSDVYYVRMNSDLEKIYETKFGGSKFEFGNDLLVNDKNEVLIVGRSSSIDGDIVNSYGGNDGWLLVLSDSDELLLSKNYGTSEHEWFESIISTSDGGYLLTGSTNSPSVEDFHGDWDYFVVKIDSAYNEIWSRAYGGSDWDMAYDAVELSNGHFILVGETRSHDGDINNWIGFYDGLVLEIDTNGDIVWSKNFGTTQSDFFKNVCTNGENVFIGGKTDGGNIFQDNAYLIVLDKYGEKIQEQIWGGTSGEIIQSIEIIEEELALSIYSRSSNGDFNCNFGNSDFVLALTNSEYEIKSFKCYGGSEFDIPNSSYINLQSNTLWMAGNSGSSDVDLEGNFGINAWILQLDLKTETNKLIIENSSIRIYPNPCINFLEINNLVGNWRFDIYTILGERIQYGIINDQKKLDISQFPIGSYQVILRSKKQSHTLSFVKI